MITHGTMYNKKKTSKQLSPVYSLYIKRYMLSGLTSLYKVTCNKKK